MAESERQGARAGESDAEPESEPDAPTVTAHATSPDRVVFTEEGNSDGWIATDLAVDSWR
ncbi:hypothetical protein [Halorientalis marina]|jgi:hypothetical protein|uniref:hypothetical protein n=1 Tax=Halorientalis marina TaxID=2931976 RepID=UPI001FF12D79|nr:hypothetical protein [Halorientalis marina]